MVDNKNEGDLVHIPTYLISHQTGLIFANFTHPNTTSNQQDNNQGSIVLKYSLEMSENEDATSANQTVIPYTLWYSGVYDFYDEFSINEVEDVFIQFSNTHFNNATEEVISHADFTPRVFTWSCLG